MTRFVVGFSAVVVAVAAVAYAGGTRSARSSSAPTATSAAQSTRGSSAAAASAAPAGPTRSVVGRVELLDRANDVTLSGTESVGLGFDKFKIEPSTEVTVNGRRASAAEINPVDDVRASFTGNDADAHLQRIEVLPSRR